MLLKGARQTLTEKTLCERLLSFSVSNSGTTSAFLGGISEGVSSGQNPDLTAITRELEDQRAVILELTAKVESLEKTVSSLKQSRPITAKAPSELTVEERLGVEKLFGAEWSRLGKRPPLSTFLRKTVPMQLYLELAVNSMRHSSWWDSVVEKLEERHPQL